jgi:Ca2+/Na+ antiporter
MRSEKSEQTFKTIRMKWHLLSDSDREKVFRNTDAQARLNRIYRRYYYFLLPLFVILVLLFALNKNPNKYLMLAMSAFTLLFLVFVIFLRFQNIEVLKRREQNFDRYGNQDFLFIELSVEKSLFYEGDDHLGSYWLGFTGQEEALLLRGENLLGFLSGLGKLKVKIIVEHLGAVVDVKGSGPKIPMIDIKDKSIVEAMEQLIVKKGLLDYLVLKGKRFSWLKKRIRE